MKSNLKYVFLMAAALVLGFSSCSNDEAGSVDNGTPKSLYLKITNGPATYAEGATVANGTSITFTSGVLYFTDASGVIKKYYTITSNATDAANIDMSVLTGAGETITGLPGDVAAVYVVGNTSGLPTTGNISAVKAYTIGVASQGTITNVNLYGEQTTLAYNAGTDTYTCTVNLAPTVARIELTNIKAGGVITGFDVAGIFVDNYYSQAAVAGTVGTPVDNGAVVANFGDNAGTYLTALKTFVYDWYSTPMAATGSPLVAAPATAGQVWGYNLFATAAGSAVPRIIIRLTNITTTSGSGISYTDDQFITIKGLKDGATSLTTIKAGEVYNIAAGAFVFDETNLTPTPNLSTIDVTVTVTLTQWTAVDVTPEL